MFILLNYKLKIKNKSQAKKKRKKRKKKKPLFLIFYKEDMLESCKYLLIDLEEV